MNPTFIAREELYSRVWTTPVRMLAAELGIAESRLRKLCDRNNIPRPQGAGYWTLLKFGKAPPPTPLPEIHTADGQDNRIRVDLPLTPIEEMAVALGDALVVPEKLTAPLPCILKAKQWLEAKDKGINDDGDEDCLHIRVSAELRDRALCIMDTLLKAVKVRGHKLIFRKHFVYIGIDNEEIKLWIRETLMRVGKIRTFNGKLRVQIYQDWGPEYSDEEASLLESQLAKIIVALEAEPAKIKARKKQWELMDAEEEEVEYEVDDDE